jgi:hypothetical protein
MFSLCQKYNIFALNIGKTAQFRRKRKNLQKKATKKYRRIDLLIIQQVCE